MRLALISLDQRWEDPAANLERCRALAATASSLGADLAVFPELTPTGFTMQPARFAEDPHDSPTVAAFRALAREAGLALAFGVALRGRARPRNTLVVVDAAGVELARYAKLHPFSLAGEADHYEAGDALATAEVAGARVGLSVCYDLRFPALYHALAPACAALLVVANWPAPRIAHWHALLQARAIEGVCYAVGVNRTGTDPNGHEYPRSSTVVSPAGDVLAPEATSGEIDVFMLDPELVARTRRRFPFLDDRRAIPALPVLRPA
jgi:omega-amidase